MSLSARRAWIEIYVPVLKSPAHGVALRKESVDRNLLYQRRKPSTPASLSARRAWIEMTTYLDTSSMDESLSARRAWIEMFSAKYASAPINWASLSARRAWIEMCDDMYLVECRFRSLSARRAWIEIRILSRRCVIGSSLSARRAWIEMKNPKQPMYHAQSLSARRAWIEITLLQQQELLSLTSLSARRAWNVSLSDCSGWFCSCGYPL